MIYVMVWTTGAHDHWYNKEQLHEAKMLMETSLRLRFGSLSEIGDCVPNCQELLAIEYWT